MRNKTKMCSKWSIEIFLAYTHNLWRVWIFAKTEDRDTRSTAESQQREDQQRRRAAAGECSPPSGRGRSTRTTSPAGCTSAPSAATSCSPGAGAEGTRIHLKCHFAAPPSMRTSPPGQHSPTPFIRTPSLRLKRRKELWRYLDIIPGDSVDCYCWWHDGSCPCCQVSCGRCGAPLGHEFLGDGPRGKSRFWIFSHALKFRDTANTDAAASKGDDQFDIIQFNALVNVLFLEVLRADSVDSGSEKNCWG